MSNRAGGRRWTLTSLLAKKSTRPKISDEEYANDALPKHRPARLDERAVVAGADGDIGAHTAGGQVDQINTPSRIRPAVRVDWSPSRPPSAQSVAETGRTAACGVSRLAVAVGASPPQGSGARSGSVAPEAYRLSAAIWRIMSHRRRAGALQDLASKADLEWVSKAHHSRPKDVRRAYSGARFRILRRELALERLGSPNMDFLIPVYVAAQASEKALTRYPQEHGRIMPTRLGNILRRHEDVIGDGIGIDAVSLAPFLSRVADQKDVARVSDEGEQMDLALRLCSVLLLVATIYLVVLAPRGLAAVIAVVPFLLAYVAYRGACVAAENLHGCCCCPCSFEPLCAVGRT